MELTQALTMAREMDAADPLASFRHEFVIRDPDLIYLDGNSLGRLPKRTAALMRELVDVEWGDRLVRAWGEHWIDLPQRLGAKIAGLVGAKPDEVLVCDSTSINFYKLAMGALALRPDRKVIVTDDANFPSDVYLMEGCAKQLGKELRVVTPQQIPYSIDDQVALLSLSHVSFKTGAIHPMQDLTKTAHKNGALTLWDLSHSAGAIPIELNASGADLAVGCTYKYLNGGPGAPAFLFIRKDLQEAIQNPIWGWFGQKNAFDFSLQYEAADALKSFMVGTPPILSMAAVESGVDLILEAGIHRLRDKSIQQTEFLIQLWRERLKPFGMSLNSPSDPNRRGSHVSFGHSDAFAIDQALIHEMNVIPDFRTPDNIRLGVTPICTTFEEIVMAVERIKTVIDERLFEKYPSRTVGVT